MFASEPFSFAADRTVSYPTEVVRFFLRRSPDFADLPSGHSLHISLPSELALESYSLANQSKDQQVFVTEQPHPQGALLRWAWQQKDVPAANELIVSTRLRSDAPEGYLVCQVSLVNPQGNSEYLQELRVKVKRLADSLQYLPEIFRRDDFTSRFLMLIESFSRPISKQIDTVYTYFDPYLTPAEFLPWLGSWFGLVLEDDLPEERRRNLLSQIAPIFAKRGTKQALISFLQMYTGGEVKITEYIDSNLVLQPSAHLGYQVALGNENRPNSFDVSLTVAEWSLPGNFDETLHRQQYKRRIETIINQFKPAHTYFRLKIDFSQPKPGSLHPAALPTLGSAPVGVGGAAANIERFLPDER